MGARLSFPSVGPLLRKMFLHPSAVVLIAANLVPVAEVLFWGWSLFDLLVLFWMENIMIGLFNILKMAITAREVDGMITGSEGKPASRLILIGFFCVHYGIFTAAHGGIVFGVFSGAYDPDTSGPSFVDLLNSFGTDFWLTAAGLVASHGFSFLWNFLIRGEYKRVLIGSLFAAPYGRVVVLHFALIVGAFLGALFGSPIPVLVLLVLLKIFLDVFFHLLERERGFISFFKEDQPDSPS